MLLRSPVFTLIIYNVTLYCIFEKCILRIQNFSFDYINHFHHCQSWTIYHIPINLSSTPHSFNSQPANGVRTVLNTSIKIKVWKVYKVSPYVNGTIINEMLDLNFKELGISPSYTRSTPICQYRYYTVKFTGDVLYPGSSQPRPCGGDSSSPYIPGRMSWTVGTKTRP